MVGKILLVVALILFYIFSMWISYIAGMTKGFKNFLDKNKDSWNEVDKALYSNFTKKNLDNVNPAAELIAENKIADLNKEIQAKKLKKARKDILKEAAKEFKKDKKKPNVKRGRKK